MIIIHDEDGEEKWQVRIAPQLATGILVQVADPKNEDETIFSFDFCNLLAEALDGRVALDGSLVISKTDMGIWKRNAALLKAYSEIITGILENSLIRDPDAGKLKMKNP